jgi:hypothetical protein
MSHVETPDPDLAFFDASPRRCPVDQHAEPRPETFNPWSVVNLVFHHLADQGLHPILGEAGDPGPPAAELLRCLGIQPAAEGNREESRDTYQHLAQIRAAMFGEE